MQNLHTPTTQQCLKTSNGPSLFSPRAIKPYKKMDSTRRFSFNETVKTQIRRLFVPICLKLQETNLRLNMLKQTCDLSNINKDIA